MKPANYEKFHHLSVLWADDDENVQKYAEHMIQKSCKKLHLAADGREAVQLYEKYQPDIVLMDVQMPRMSGLEAVAKIRAVNPLVPVVMITGMDDRETLLNTIRLSVEDYLIKPFSYPSLLAALDRCIDRIASRKAAKAVFPGGTTYDPFSGKLTSGDDFVKLTKKEKIFLELLLLNHTRIVTTDEISWHVWGSEAASDGSLKTLLNRLRKKIGKGAVQNHSGIGYSIVLEKN